MFLKKKGYFANHKNSYHLEDLSPSTNQVRFSSISKDEHELLERRVPFRDGEDACDMGVLFELFKKIGIVFFCVNTNPLLHCF